MNNRLNEKYEGRNEEIYQELNERLNERFKERFRMPRKIGYLYVCGFVAFLLMILGLVLLQFNNTRHIVDSSSD